MEVLMTVLAVFCGIALVGMFIGWWAAERRSARAERAANRAERRAGRYQDEARRARRDAAAAYRCLTQYMPANQISEAVRFAGVPGEVDGTVTLPAHLDATFELFLTDVRGR